MLSSENTQEEMDETENGDEHDNGMCYDQQGSIPYHDESVYMDKDDIIDDTVELSGCSFIATKFNGRASRKKSKQRITQESSPGELMEVLAISNIFYDNDGMFVCDICKRNFSSAKRKDSHVCKGSICSRDMASMAIKYAHELVTTGQVDYLETQYEFVSEATTSLDLLKDDLRECFYGIVADAENEKFPAGWGKRAAHGKGFGAKYIGAFVGDIDRMFLAGVEDKRNKLSPGRMLEQLRILYPNHLDLPSETEIRQRVTSLFSKLKHMLYVVV